MKLRRDRMRPARIEMMPLIDIVFLLLVFFIYAMLSMAVHQGLPVQLPSSSAVEVDRENAVALTVQSTSDGIRLAINKEQVALGDLTDRLRQLAAGDELREVQVFGDKDVSYQHLFQVLDRVHGAGLSRISLVAEQEEQ